MSSKINKDSIKIEENKESKEMKYSFNSVTLLVCTCLMLIANVYCYLGPLEGALGALGLWAVIASCVLFLLAFLFFFKNFAGWLKAELVAVIIISLFTWGYFLFVVFDLIHYLQNPDDLQALIQSTGAWSYIVFVLVQFLQVTFIPLPAIVPTLVGTLLFGPGMATILSLIGIGLGSIFAFVLGDKLGERVVSWIVGKKNVEKYGNMLYDKGKYMFFLMMLFPVFPDDILCLVAGMTSMSYRFFFTTLILTRPIGIVMTCYLGSGDIIPYDEPWGIAVWAVLILLIVLAFWISFKYKNKIESIVNKACEAIKNFLIKTGKAIKTSSQNFIALFSKSYKAKLLLKRNKLPYLLLPQNCESQSTPSHKSQE